MEKKMIIKNKLHYWDLLDTDKDVAEAVYYMTTGNIDNSIPDINCVMNNNQLTKEQSELAIALTKFYLTHMAQ
tara:strand:+ start:392 stop:610 length:219 start_codon:yes stop_codon:yes gene_type:complete